METENIQNDFWQNAQTLEALCELNARYIEGEVDFSPTYGGPLDEESGPLIPYLAALNRSGFFTITSQPGEDDGHSKQRALVDGFASEETAQRIERLSLVSDLYILTSPPGRYNGCTMPITTDLFRPYSWAGAVHLEDETGLFLEIPHIEKYCGSVQGLREAWYVCVIDLCWGRKDYLWRILTDELCVTLEPHDS